ncbi:hypothetical protein MA16_Dca005989 [Dendrobium catenatum]|uniref:Uncharacterized protein n=1 Tax=Dendrobium catenatum TaxID=906689 RepID=A0A2I0WJV9_9ASPA|nr:hypothetical protein MA16_Dca005989 [Dendrobium catenatum]
MTKNRNEKPPIPEASHNKTRIGKGTPGYNKQPVTNTKNQPIPHHQKNPYTQHKNHLPHKQEPQVEAPNPANKARNHTPQPQKKPQRSLRRKCTKKTKATMTKPQTHLTQQIPKHQNQHHPKPLNPIPKPAPPNPKSGKQQPEANRNKHGPKTHSPRTRDSQDKAPGTKKTPPNHTTRINDKHKENQFDLN